MLASISVPLQVFSFLSTFTCNKMYSRFVFGNFNNKKLNKRQHHARGAFKDVFDGTDINNVLWYSEKRIYQAKLKSIEQNGVTDMVALIPQFSTNQLHTSSANTADSDKCTTGMTLPFVQIFVVEVAE